MQDLELWKKQKLKLEQKWIVAIATYIRIWNIASFIYFWYIQNYILTKHDVPECKDEKVEFAQKLLKYEISLVQYTEALKRDKISMLLPLIH